jgi:hypothetical protein
MAVATSQKVAVQPATVRKVNAAKSEAIRMKNRRGGPRHRPAGGQGSLAGHQAGRRSG